MQSSAPQPPQLQGPWPHAHLKDSATSSSRSLAAQSLEPWSIRIAAHLSLAAAATAASQISPAGPSSPEDFGAESCGDPLRAQGSGRGAPQARDRGGVVRATQTGPCCARVRRGGGACNRHCIPFIVK